MAQPYRIHHDTVLCPQLLSILGFKAEQLPHTVWWRLTLPPHPQVPAQEGLQFVVGVEQKGNIGPAPCWVLEVQIEQHGQVLGRCPLLSQPLVTLGHLLGMLKGIGISIECEGAAAPNPLPEAAGDSHPITVKEVHNGEVSDPKGGVQVAQAAGPSFYDRVKTCHSCRN